MHEKLFCHQIFTVNPLQQDERVYLFSSLSRICVPTAYQGSVVLAINS